MGPIGRFEVFDVLGLGRVGTVYRARDGRDGAEVALKALDPQLVGTKVEQRFLREGEALRSLHHPNVVRVLDVGQDPPWVWISMELMDRGNAHALASERGGLPVSWVLHVADGLLAGLEHVHAAGMIHRDVKPANVLLDHRARVTLGDFGVVRDDRSVLTLPGAKMGTGSYMSPEQLADATRVTPRSDLFSVGATLFALATGRTPRELAWFEPGDDRWKGAWALVPDELRGILRKACAYHPEARYPDAAAMRSAVHAVQLALRQPSP